MSEAIPPLKTHSTKRLGWLIHGVGWCVLLTFPFLFITGRGSDDLTWNGYLRFVFVIGSYIIVFYVNYLYLVKKFLFTKQVMRYLLGNALLIMALIVAVSFLLEIVLSSEERYFPEPEGWDLVRFFAINMLSYIFVGTISVAYKMTGSWYTAESERKELERSRSEAELKNLKSQLNPHFLFNTLNNIYSLIAISPERAQEVVHGLSRLLRYVLYESGQPFVTVEKDLDFIRNYVELMRIRLSGHVQVTMSVSYTSSDLLIAPLLFITPIENAFKHGVNNTKTSFIRIEITAADKEINCRIENSYFPKNEGDKSGSGIGLSNLRKRLNLIYPGKHYFSYGQKENTYYCELKLCQL
ncbi:MAG: histidine kinase [Tannerellaceae bacterium]|jgi:sensor histidine kinase YesM|nr:histidine kinase [Tannerellaceae bacterium]